MDTMDFLWQKAVEKLFLTKEQFLASLDGWEIETVVEKGVELGVVLRKGSEFHFATTGRPISRTVVRQVLQKQFGEFGYVTTRTPKQEERQHRFNRALGFVATGEDEFDVIYRLDQIRRPGCPSQQ